MKKRLLLLCIIVLYVASKGQAGTPLRRTYFLKYEKQVKDTTTAISSKEDSELLLIKEAQDNQSMTLSDRYKNTLLLEDLLKKHEGKIVYIDFWASWCKPCIAALPSSVKLRESLKDLPVVFVYLSIDEKTRRWRKASRKEKLKKYPENYLVRNPDESEFLKKHKFNSIPRYMIFDKSGNLIDAMAPGPVNEDADIVLMKLAATK